MRYEDVFAEAKRLWLSDGGASAALGYVQRFLESASGENVGLLKNLSAKFHKRLGHFESAYKLAVEALDSVTDPEHRVDILCNALDICASLRRIEAGLRHAHEVEELLPLLPPERATQWEPHYLYGLGSLYLMAGDLTAALPRFKRAAELFQATGRENESWAARVEVAQIQVRLGDLDGAELLCLDVIVNCDSAYVRAKANAVLCTIESLRGFAAEAERLWDKAWREAAEVIGKKDLRLMLQLLTVKGDLDERRGDRNSALILRMIVERLSAVGRIDLDDWRGDNDEV